MGGSTSAHDCAVESSGRERSEAAGGRAKMQGGTTAGTGWGEPGTHEASVRFGSITATFETEIVLTFEIAGSSNPGHISDFVASVKGNAG